MKKTVALSVVLTALLLRAAMRLLHLSQVVFSVVYQYTISLTHIQETLSALLVRRLPKHVQKLSKMRVLRVLKYVQCSHVSLAQEFVESATDVTLLPQRWFRRVRLLVSLLLRLSVSQVLSLLSVHSTQVVLPVMQLPMLRLLQREMCVLSLTSFAPFLLLMTVKDLVLTARWL